MTGSNSSPAKAMSAIRFSVSVELNIIGSRFLVVGKPHNAYSPWGPKSQRIPGFTNTGSSLSSCPRMKAWQGQEDEPNQNPCTVRKPQASIAALSVLRIHSEMVCFLTLAAFSIRWRSSGLKRTCMGLPLASPTGSFGRPGFLGLGGISVFLHKNGLYGSSGRDCPGEGVKPST
jgi:hypothetical protein